MRRRGILTAAAALLMAVVPATAAVATPTKPHPVRVPATAEPWVSSGIEVTAGEPLEISARGFAITGPLAQYPEAKSGPDGQFTTLCPDLGGPSVGCALDMAPYGALIARIGGTTFYVGSFYLGGAPDTGVLEFAVNDNLGYSNDNAGGYTVFVNR